MPDAQSGKANSMKHFATFEEFERMHFAWKKQRESFG
jgi:hypothetical protein